MNPRATVLVVDDEQGIRDSVERMLKRQQYEVCVAENGKNALDILRQRKVNVMPQGVRNCPSQSTTSSRHRRWSRL